VLVFVSGLTVTLPGLLVDDSETENGPESCAVSMVIFVVSLLCSLLSCDCFGNHEQGRPRRIHLVPEPCPDLRSQRVFALEHWWQAFWRDVEYLGVCITIYTIQSSGVDVAMATGSDAEMSELSAELMNIVLSLLSKCSHTTSSRLARTESKSMIGSR
jgi:hypothetical protein